MPKLKYIELKAYEVFEDGTRSEIPKIDMKIKGIFMTFVATDGSVIDGHVLPCKDGSVSGCTLFGIVKDIEACLDVANEGISHTKDSINDTMKREFEKFIKKDDSVKEFMQWLEEKLRK